MCAGCTKAAMERAEKMKAESESKSIPAPYPPPRLGINCYCGLLRLIPTGLNVDDTFELCPCPRCGMSFKGKFKGDGVEEINV